MKIANKTCSNLGVGGHLSGGEKWFGEYWSSSKNGRMCLSIALSAGMLGGRVDGATCNIMLIKTL